MAGTRIFGRTGTRDLGGDFRSTRGRAGGLVRDIGSGVEETTLKNAVACRESMGALRDGGGGEEVESRRSGRRRLEIYSLPSKVADSGVEMPAGAAWAFWGVLGGYEYRVALGEALCGW